MSKIQVASNSNPKDVAGAIANIIREEGKSEIECIGAGAINQAVKSMAIARGYVAPNGVDLVMMPHFEEFEIEENQEKKTGIVFNIEPR